MSLESGPARPAPRPADGGVYDIFVVGGGINGCGIARDAAGRGFSVHLAEQNDLASGTSSWSTKLIHGGLRYLEHREFRLVRESLAEREVLWRMAPHIIHPLRFILPHHRGLRPRWLLRLGLFLYDNIGGRKLLPATKTLDLTKDPVGPVLKPEYARGFEYSDCSVDDTRLVVLNARDAADRGAVIRTQAKVVSARRDGALWHVTVEDRESGAHDEVKARMLVNAAGPWVDKVLRETVGETDAHNVRLVQGSHIVTRKLYDDPRAFIFQNSDNRIFFAIPYQSDFTLIGTTDRDYRGLPEDVAITEDEIVYLCRSASEYLRKPVSREDVVWSFSGVRPLFDDGASKAQEATRDYVLRLEGEGAPLLDVFGGKLTTYRRLAQSALEKIEGCLGRKGSDWTASAALPGGEFPVAGLGAEIARLQAEYPFLGATHAQRMIRLYGRRAWAILGSAKSLADCCRCFGGDLYEAEVSYLMREEWARSAEDVLWRRTKLGLILSPEEAAGLEAWMSGTRSRPLAATAADAAGAAE
ncbi:MAG: glycerol-3-phosphate dehydrogenase [Methylobacterium mesophilicum]|nr:glycerol-3-phosphate dehydrogenase [Methylobacterium mesophilicum]